MMPQPHQLIQKVTGFTGSNIFEQSFVGEGNLPGKVGAPDPAEKRKYLLQTYKHL